MKPIIVHLTPKQMEAITPAIDAAVDASLDGKPGMCVAQIYPDHMVVGFLRHASAVRLLKAMGAPTDRRTRGAMDRSDVQREDSRE